MFTTSYTRTVPHTQRHICTRFVTKTTTMAHISVPYEHESSLNNRVLLVTDYQYTANMCMHTWAHNYWRNCMRLATTGNKGYESGWHDVQKMHQKWIPQIFSCRMKDNRDFTQFLVRDIEKPVCVLMLKMDKCAREKEQRWHMFIAKMNSFIPNNLFESILFGFIDFHHIDLMNRFLLLMKESCQHNNITYAFTYIYNFPFTHSSHQLINFIKTQNILLLALISFSNGYSP